MLALVVLSLSVLGVFAAGGVIALRRPRSSARLVVPSGAAASAGPRVSVLVPARDEEARLGACLASLRAQDHPDLELVVVDDRSTDRTGQIVEAAAAADPRVVLVRGGEPPPGWFGKPNALRQAFERATGEWLLMTDADTIHGPGSVRAALAYARREGVAALSALPRMRCEGFWPRLLVPQLGALLYAGRSAKRVNTPGDEVAFGNGPYFFVRRDAYLAAGGIAAVRGAPDEDLAFARALKRTGLGYHFVEGEDVCSVATYTRLSEFYAGFGRNLWPAMDRSWVRLAKVTLVVWIMSLVPLATAILCALRLQAPAPAELPALALLAGVGQYPVVLALQASIRARSGFPAWLAILAPVGGLVTWSVVAYSAWRWESGRGSTWKGRSIPAK